MFRLYVQLISGEKNVLNGGPFDLCSIRLISVSVDKATTFSFRGFTNSFQIDCRILTYLLHAAESFLRS